MKSSIATLLFIGLASLAIGADQKSAEQNPPAKPAAAKRQEIKVPADAVEIAPYTFRSTDSEGKTWIYRQTPFGVSRTEDKPLSAEDAKKAQDAKDRLIQSTTAVEDGDSIRFSQNWPFGRTQWRKKKTDLNEIEQAVWNRELAKRTSSETASKD